jgi:hypothetical protein
MSYVTHIDYEKDEKYKGICFGLSSIKKGDNDYEIKMHYDDSLGVMGET